MSEQLFSPVPDPAELQVDLGPRREFARATAEGVKVRTLFLDSGQAVAIPLIRHQQGALARPNNEKKLTAVAQPGVNAYMSVAIPTTAEGLASADVLSIENLITDINNSRARILGDAGIAGAAAMPYHALVGMEDLQEIATADARKIAAELRTESALIGNPAFFANPDLESASGYTLVRDPDKPSPVTGVTVNATTGQVEALPLTEKLLKGIVNKTEGSPDVFMWMSIEMIEGDPMAIVAGRDYPLAIQSDSWPCPVFNTIQALPLFNPEESSALRGLRQHIIEMREGILDIDIPGAVPSDEPTPELEPDLEDDDDDGFVFKGSLNGLFDDAGPPGSAARRDFLRII